MKTDHPGPTWQHYNLRRASMRPHGMSAKPAHRQGEIESGQDEKPPSEFFRQSLPLDHGSGLVEHPGISNG